jgi:hypothetical protein
VIGVPYLRDVNLILPGNQISHHTTARSPILLREGLIGGQSHLTGKDKMIEKVSERRVRSFCEEAVHCGFQKVIQVQSRNW